MELAILSNDLNVLFENFSKLIFANPSPFDKRLVVVPSTHTKNWLQRKLAEKIGISCGIQFMRPRDLLSLPSHFELSLAIEKELEKKPPPELFSYLKGPTERLLDLSSDLASFFFLQKENCAELTENWQKELFEKVFPFLEIVPIDAELHFFALPFLPKIYHRLIEQSKTPVFHHILSFCELFWTDIYSDKAIKRILRKGKKIDSTLTDRNALLANFGKSHQSYLKIIEEREVETLEAYKKPLANTFLNSLKANVFSLEPTISPDPTLQIHAANSKLQEVEMLFEHILKSNKKASSFLVLAPNIQAYAHYIRLVFGKSINYNILGLVTDNSFVESIERLHNDLYSLFPYPNFKSGLAPDEIELLLSWIEKTKGNFSRLFDGFTFMLEDFEFAAPLGGLKLGQADILDKFLEVFEDLKKEQKLLKEKHTTEEWADILRNLGDKYFIEKAPSSFLNKLKKSKAEDLFSLKSLLRHLKGKKNYSENVLEAVTFSSIEEGAIVPTDEICLIGMNEEFSPRSFIANSPVYSENFLLEALFMTENLYISFVEESKFVRNFSSYVNKLK